MLASLRNKPTRSKENYVSSRIYSHWSFADGKLNMLRYREARETLFQTPLSPQAIFLMPFANQTLNKMRTNKRTKSTKGWGSLL